MQQAAMSPPITGERWYVAYTLPKHEKAAAQRLSLERLTCYVPLYLETRIWSGRRVILQLPLFPCYVFVRMLTESKARLLSTPGVVRLLTLSGSAVVIPDEDMDALQSSLRRWSARPYPFHSHGKTVRLRSGPFAGMEGTILRRNGKRKLIVNLQLINCSVSLDCDAADAELFSG